MVSRQDRSRGAVLILASSNAAGLSFLLGFRFLDMILLIVYVAAVAPCCSCSW